jgi:hypothetical protein
VCSTGRSNEPFQAAVSRPGAYPFVMPTMFRPPNRRGRALYAALVLSSLLLGACASDGEVVDDPATYVVDFDVVAEGMVHGDESTGAGILLARSDGEARRAARRIGIDEVSTILRSWTRYPDRALIALVGTGRSGEGSRLEVELVQGPALINEVVVTAHTEPVPQLAPATASVAWIVLSVQRGQVDAATECVLVLDGRDLPSPCVPIER